MVRSYATRRIFIRPFLLLMAYVLCALPTYLIAADSSDTVVAVEINDDYYERLKQVNSRVIDEICHDANTPAEVLDWIVDNKKMGGCGYKTYLRHPNLSAETIKKILDIVKKNPDQKILEAIILHPNTMADTRAEIIDIVIADTYRFNNVVYTVARQEGELTPDAEKLLRSITYSEYQDFRLEVAKSPRLPPDLVEYFVNTEEILVRSHVSYNPQLSLDQLIKLANDKYRPVQTPALFRIEDRFPDKYESVKASLRPEAGSLKSSTLQYALGEAIKRKDMDAVEQLIPTLKKYHLVPYYAEGIGAAIVISEETIVKRIHEAFPEHYHINKIAEDENFDTRWLMFFHGHGWLERFSNFEVMHAMLENNRWALYGRMVIEGYEVNPINPANNLSLFRISVFTPTFFLMSPIVGPLILITGCLIYVLIKRRTSSITAGLVILSSFIFLPATGSWAVLIGLGCWGCSNPLSGVLFVLQLWLVLILSYFFIGRILKGSDNTA